MAQHNGVKPTGLPPTTASSSSSSFAPLSSNSNTSNSSNGTDASDGGVNAELLMSMMNCVDTSLFSAQQLHNWEQMKLRIKLAAEQNTPLAPDVVQDFIVKNTPKATISSDPQTQQTTQQTNVDYRQPLHREASIQDVLACLLEQQAPTSRTMSSSGGSFLINSEVKNRAQHASANSSSSSTDETKPTLKSLLSSNDFSMTEKKESLRHLLSFIDNSFAATAEPLTQVYKDCEEGTLQRLSSLQLMRSFMTPTHPANAHAMGRTTSFEIIQAMLNATSNQAIQKPMSSQDSFRFQHLARTLESIESDVGYDNEDYGGDDVVQVDNLDNLLDYHGPASGSASSGGGTAPPNASSANANPHVGFVDTQTLVNPTRSIYTEYGSMAPGAAYQQQQQTQYGQSDPNSMYASQYSNSSAASGAPANSASSSSSGAPSAMFGDSLSPYQQQQQQLGAAQNMLKLEHGATQHHALQQQLLQQQQKFQQQQQHNPFQYQNAMLAQQQQANSMLLAQVSAGAYSRAPDASQQQQYAAMLLQQQAQQTPFHHHAAGSAQRIPVPLHAQTLSQVKQHKQEAAGGAQICSALGCNHPARVKGMCKLHGGGRRCKVDGCMKSAQTGHLCIAHGGGKPCNVEGCPKTAQSRGLCKQHGGGVRCKFEGCTKSCQSGGFCRGHGGGKRCEFPNCTKWAQKNGHCAKHAQELTQKSATSHP